MLPPEHGVHYSERRDSRGDRTGNPMRELKANDLGGGRSADTYAYSLDEISAMLQVLPEPAQTVVATAAFTGLRRAELRGLKWEDLNGNELRIQRTVWGTVVGDTKTSASRASIPVIPLLQERLEEHRNGFGAHDFIFAGDKLGRSLNLANLARRTIVPVLAAHRIGWHGWHAFRRGLVTNLHALGVDGKDIQSILRHANIATTLNVYTKPDLAKARSAMAKLSKAFAYVDGRVDVR
jgi:integrase